VSLRHSPRLTPAALAANRRNAQQSTGPRTPAGKRRARLNALKHGLCSRSFAQTVISSGEDRAQFERGLTLLRLALVPAGRAAGRMAELLARMMWTRSRAARRGGRQPFFLLSPREKALMLRVVRVCQWWYADEGVYRRDTTNPECPLESADSSRNGALFPFQLPAVDPALLRRVGKRTAKTVYHLARQLAAYEIYTTKPESGLKSMG
jgi:hypothetical protein